MHTTDTAVVHGLGSATQELSRRAGGPVLRAGDPEYAEARLGWNRTVDSRPGAILLAQDAHDVQAAVQVARERQLPFALQATGHGTLVPCDGALLVKTTALDAVDIDPHRRLARVGPGATWHQVNAAAAASGLGSLAGRCGTVGVTGYTIGGGAGWLARTFGYAADSVVSADVVLADGTLVTADHDRHAELFWGLRGGSGNFGAVTSLTFQLYAAERVWCGMSLYPRERAAEILTAYRDWSTDEPAGMNTAVLLMRLPKASSIPEPLRGEQVVAIRVFALVDEATGRRQVAPLLRAAGAPLHDGFAVRDFATGGTATNGPDVPPIPNRQLFHAFDRLSDELLGRLVRDGLHPQSPYAFVELRHWGGAMARPEPDAGPAGMRNTPWSVVAVAPYLDQDRTETDAVLDAFDGALAASATGESFLTLLTEPARTTTAFTPENLRRLVALKRALDPDTFFRPSHTISAA